MASGQRYHELIVGGASYQDVADAYGVSYNSVNSKVNKYRKDNGIKMRAPKEDEPEPQKQSVKNARAYLTQSEREEKARRKEEIKACKRDENGVLKCPPRYAEGYGIKTPYLRRGECRG